MNKATQQPNTSEFCRWQSPRRLLYRCDLVSKEMTNQAFLADGKGFEKTIPEAIVAANFALRCHALITPISAIRMAPQNTEGMDFEIKSKTIHQFEITTAYDVGRHIREDYRDGRQLDTKFENVSAEPEWVAPSIRNKTEKKLRVEKRQSRIFHRHLLVNQNFLKHRGGTDLRRLRDLVSSSESAWRSVWLILGVSSESINECAIALLYPSPDFNCPVGEWLPNVTT